MTQLLSLIGVSDGDLTSDLADSVLSAAGLDSGGIDWLAPGRALERPAGAVGAAELNGLRERFRDLPVDINLVPAEGRRKKLLIADMDSTVITSESLDELAALAGVADQVLPITRRAMNGELDFAEALRARLKLIEGQPTALLDRIREQSVVTEGAAALVATMRENDAYTALVSGGFTFLTADIAERVGFNTHQANVLEHENGRLLGRVREPILDRDAKVKALDRLGAELGIGREDALTVGDGSNDIAMLQAAGLGVAFHGKPVVREAVPVRIDKGDLLALLYLQGYRAAEIRR